MSQQVRRAKVLPDNEPFSVGQLRKVIPEHCFERSYLISFIYLFTDFLKAAILVYVGTYIDDIQWVTLRWAAWVVHCFASGVVGIGLWVLAHECGHQAFSPSLVVNDTVGFIVHSMLLVPYWSWKYSHAQHHSNANSMDGDSVFVPYTDLKRRTQPNYLRTAPRRVYGIFEMLVFGWPAYLWFNVQSSAKGSEWRSHFNPFCSLWKTNQQRIGVAGSVVGVAAWSWVLYRLTLTLGWVTMVKFYWIPYVWVNFWLIVITFLQHTDAVVPKYYSSKWTWLRGAFGTVDRDFGIFNILHHHISDTHVLHHIFSIIPHYHAQEATQALLDSGLINDYYLSDPTPWYVALWRNYRECWFVRHDQPITWFESAATKLKET